MYRGKKSIFDFINIVLPSRWNSSQRKFGYTTLQSNTNKSLLIQDISLHPYCEFFKGGREGYKFNGFFFTQLKEMEEH